MYVIIEVRKKKKRYNKGYLYTKGNYKIFVISRDDGFESGIGRVKKIT